MNWNLSANLFGFEDRDSKGQRIFRTALELFIAGATVYLAWTWGSYTLRVADIVLELGLARYIDISFMHGNNLPLYNAGAITVLLGLGFFRVGRWPYAVAFVLLLLQYAARFTLGEIPHSANLVGTGLLGFALGQLFFPDEVSRTRFGLGFTYLFVGLAYTFAAWSKLIGTGINWPDGRHLWMWINEKAVDEIARSGFVELNFLQEIVLSSIVLATLFLIFGLISEFFAFLLWFKPFRTWVIIALIGLHMGIWMTMDILFKLSIIELVLLAPPWAKIIDAHLDKRSVKKLAGAAQVPPW